MLLQFSVKNYRSFKEKATLSLIASNYDKEVNESENVYLDKKFGIRILKSAATYGANASGKTKLFEAIGFMKKLVISSSKDTQLGDSIDVDPFLLNVETESEPSEFEIIFLYKNTIYRYGFEVTKKEVISEWLYKRSSKKESEIFYRDQDSIDTNRVFPKGRTLVKEGLVRNNALLLSVAAQFNDEITSDVITWFRNVRVLSGLNELGFRGFTLNKTGDSKYKQKILSLLKAADLGIKDIVLEKLDISKLPKDLPIEIREKFISEIKGENTTLLSDIYTIHNKYDINNEMIGTTNFSLDDDESSGTKKFFALMGPILDVLENGYVFVIDELDAKLHPNLVEKIVALFNSTEYNKNNAQLIFNTHNSNLLDSSLLRRDQVWFMDKNRYGESKIYSLASFKSKEVSKNEDLQENYIRGKYGGVPFLNYFKDLHFVGHENEKL